MCPRVSQKLARLLFVSPTAIVSQLSNHLARYIADHTIDANAFKEAFIKAQQENEALFKADAGEGGEVEVPKAE